MEQTLSAVLVVWGVVGMISLWIAANALADFGARRLRRWVQSSRHHPQIGDD